MKKLFTILVAALCFCAFTNKAFGQFNGKSQLQASAQFQTSAQATPCAATGEMRGTLLTEGFEGDLSGWKKENNSPTNNTWTVYETVDEFSAHSGSKFAANAWSETSMQARDAWLFSPGMTMTAGTTYTISFWLHLAGYQENGEYDYFEAKISQTQSGGGMGSGTTLYSNTNQWLSNWTQISKTFTPTASGTYYLGFHAFTPAEQGNLIAIDDVEVSDGGSSGGDFSGGTGTENDPYIITTAQELALLATYTNAGNESYNDKYYKLGNDIDLSAYQSGTGWTPIGNDNYRFRGSFDGNEKKITGLYINNPSLYEAGLFGCTLNATIKNVAVVNVNVKGDWRVGSVVGSFFGGNIENSYSTGNVSGSNWIGGIAGRMKDGSSSYPNPSPTIKNCYFSGKVSGSENYIGGLAGLVENGGVISTSYSAGEVNGDERIGGVAGNIYRSAVINCYSISEVSGNKQVGGIVGVVYILYGDPVLTQVLFCVALNPSVKGTLFTGRVAADAGIVIDNAAYDGILNINGNTIWENKGLNFNDGEDMTLQQIKSDGSLGGRFKTSDGWTIQNGKLPGLFGQAVNMPAHLGGVGIETITNDELRITVFPNPANEQLTINNEQLIINNVEIFDVMGRPVVGSNLCVRPATTIDISHLPSGVYFVKIYTENGVVTQKVVKN